MTGVGEKDRGEVRGEGGSGDHAKPGFTYGLVYMDVAPGDEVRVMQGLIPAATVGEVRGDKGGGAWVQLKLTPVPSVARAATRPRLAARTVERMAPEDWPPAVTPSPCGGESDRGKLIPLPMLCVAWCAACLVGLVPTRLAEVWSQFDACGYLGGIAFGTCTALGLPKPSV